MATMNLLETHNLSRNFGGIQAVNNVDFALRDGEIRALIGPNGAGKTTFVSLITGRILPSSGTITFANENITKLPAHKRIAKGMGYTFQITSIFPDLTCFENVYLAAQREFKGSQKKLSSFTKMVVEQVGLNNFREEIAGDLSYGHQRLLEIAMGIAQRPKLLILDEPTQGLAGGEIKDFMFLIREISDRTTILLIEHNMDVVMGLADTITVLDQGAILAEGTPDEIRANTRVQDAYLGG